MHTVQRTTQEIMIMHSTPDYTEEDVFVYLDNVRESGVTNMYGASPYIREEFGVNRYEANRLLTKWMETFSERHSQ